jgi:hypothetical protein
MQSKNYVLCLKHGKKYSSEYVNNLYSMVKRNLSLPHEFVCMTEDPNGLNPEIRDIELKTSEYDGWWYKPTVFDPSLGLEGTVLFIDLDVVIFNSIDKFFEYEPEKFCIIRGFRKNNKNGMNSSCFRFKTGSLSEEYHEFVENSKSIVSRLDGDQDWMQEAITDYSFWPDGWLMSYKWEMVDHRDITKVSNDRYRVFVDPRTKEETSIAVFHGYPKPHQIENNWCQKHWR